MTIERSRRDMLKGTLAVSSLALLNIPEWALPALAQGDTLVPFTDAPPAFPAPGPVNRQYDVRTIDGPFTLPIVSLRRSITVIQSSSPRRSA